MSASDDTNNGPRANDAVANRDGRQDADASPQDPAAAPVDRRFHDETANGFGSFYQGGFAYGSGHNNNNNNNNNRNPHDGTRRYEPAPWIDPNQEASKSRTFHRCQPPPEDPPSGPSDKDGDSSNRT